MNGSGRIDFVALDREETFLPVQDAYRFEPKSKLTRRLCAWARRRGWLTNDMDKKVTVHRRVIDPDRVVAAVGSQISEIRRRGGTPQQVLVGAEDYSRLMHDAGPLETAVEFTGQYGWDGRVYGVRIRVLPNLRGVVVVPV